MKGKKGILPVLLSFPVLVVLAVILLLVLGFVVGFGFFLVANPLTIAGVFILVISGVALLKGIGDTATVLWIGLVGIVLIMMPLLSDKLSTLTLAAVLS